MQHNNNIVELQGIDFLFSLLRLFLKLSLLDCVTSNNLLEVYAIFECYHRCGLICCVRLSVYLQDIPVSIHNFRYVAEFSVVSYWQWNYFLSILSSCLIAQVLSISVVVEQIVFSLKAWLYGMLLFSRNLECSDLGTIHLWHPVKNGRNSDWTG